jgi:hypothetical protein
VSSGPNVISSDRLRRALVLKGGAWKASEEIACTLSKILIDSVRLTQRILAITANARLTFASAISPISQSSECLLRAVNNIGRRYLG